jgi:GTP-binding protein HflX
MPAITTGGGYRASRGGVGRKSARTAVPCLQVFNKIDLTGEPPRLERDAQGQVRAVWLSAAPWRGNRFIGGGVWPSDCAAMPCTAGCACRTAARLRARLFGLGAVLGRA